jgi:hypothetical protein
VAIDDASRLAYAEILPDEKGDTSAALLVRAVEWFKRKGVRVRRTMTDNGSGYVSACFGLACTRLKIRHLRTLVGLPYFVHARASWRSLSSRHGSCEVRVFAGAGHTLRGSESARDSTAVAWFRAAMRAH